MYESYLFNEVYRWRNSYEIQEHFNKMFRDEWCDYKHKYQMIDCGYYPIVNFLDKMQSIVSDFVRQYLEGSKNIFYEGNW